MIGRRAGTKPRAPAAAGHGTAEAFGTFGELLQGRLPESDVDFLVTMPIDRWSTCSFHYEPRRSEVRVRPPRKLKSRRLAEAMLRHYGREGGGTLEITSDIPEGKGFASSSADLVATARAVGLALQVEPTSREIEDLLRDIEPTDGVMYDEVVAFRHREVRLHERLGSLPPLTIVGVDEGGEVSTIEFNRIPKLISTADKRAYGTLLSRAVAAVGSGDADAIGRVATRSALMNQRLRPKRLLDRMLAACREIGGLGVVTAHSGTASGILLSDDDPDYVEQLSAARRACASMAGTVLVDHCLSIEEVVDPLSLEQSWQTFEVMSCSSTP